MQDIVFWIIFHALFFAMVAQRQLALVQTWSHTSIFSRIFVSRPCYNGEINVFAIMIGEIKFHMYIHMPVVKVWSWSLTFSQ